MNRVIISHGTLGNPRRAWIPWLSEELTRAGMQVIAPHYPTPEDQSFDSWRAAFAAAAGELQPADILVGHSAGAVFSLRLLEHSAVMIKGAFLVAGFVKPIGHPVFDALNFSFIDPGFNWEKIRNAAEVFESYSSDNDPLIPLELGLEVALNLRIQPEIIHNGGHLNADSGYSRFPKLFEKIYSLCS